MWRFLLVAAVGCISQVTNAVNPPAPAGGGTLTCAQIVETCDSQCTQPLCLRGCSSNGTTEGQQQHDALLACGQNNGCTDEACVRTNCPGEVTACEGSATPAADPPAADPPPAS